MNRLPKLLLIGALLLPLTACDNGAGSTPLPSPDTTGVPGDDGRIFTPPADKPISKDPTPPADPTGSGNKPGGNQPGNNGNTGNGNGGSGNGGNPPPVPEPGTLLLVGAGLAALAARNRNRNRKRDGEEEELEDGEDQPQV